MARWIIAVALGISLFSALSSAEGVFESDSTDKAPSFASSNLSQPPEFLDPEIAFTYDVQEDDQSIQWRWQIEPGYYLYKKRFSVTTLDNQAITGFTLSEGTVPVDDPDFGKVDVYYQQASLSLPKALIPQGIDEVKVRYQGCAEAGLCYPPQYATYAFQASSSAKGASNTGAEKKGVQQSNSPQSTQDWQRLLSEASLATLVFLFFLGGLLLTFTPCVLPMVPILSTIVLGDAQRSHQSGALRGLILSLSYVLGMALTFAGAGVLAGLLGAQFNLQIYMQSPWVLIPFVLIFVALAFAMFGFYELQLPESLRDKLTSTSSQLKGGQLVSVFFIGALSALVVSPCVSAPLAGALAYISTTGNALLGGLGLLALGLGMGTPLLIIGTTGAKVLPKAGTWMDKVKHFFGVLLLGVALVLLERLIPQQLGLVLWALLIGIYGVHLGAFEAATTGWQKTFKGIGLFLLLYAVLLFVGAAQGHKALWPPLPQGSQSTSVASNTTFAQPTAKQQAIVINSQQMLQKYLTKAQDEHKLVMVDLYADWCIACKEMENRVLYTPEVSSKLSNLYWLKFDMTDFNDDHKAFLAQYQLFGPPAFLFFGFNGEEIADARIVGELDKTAFLNHLDQFEL